MKDRGTPETPEAENGRPMTDHAREAASLNSRNCATGCRALPGSASPASPTAWTSRSSRYPLPRAVHRRRRPARRLDFPQFALRVATRSPRRVACQPGRIDFPQFASPVATRTARRRRPPARPHGLSAIRATRRRTHPRRRRPPVRPHGLSAIRDQGPMWPGGDFRNCWPIGSPRRCVEYSWHSSGLRFVGFFAISATGRARRCTGRGPLGPRLRAGWVSAIRATTR